MKVRPPPNVANGLAKMEFCWPPSCASKPESAELPTWLIPPEEMSWLIKSWIFCPPSPAKRNGRDVKQVERIRECEGRYSG